jgi:flagellar biosynthesis/type III secretory pathway protein FliH
MDWKKDLDALIEETMAFAKSVKSYKPTDVPPLAAVEQTLAESPKPNRSAPSMPAPRSERDEIEQRVASFKAHQERVKREREEYYAEITAKTRAIIDANPPDDVA